MKKIVSLLLVVMMLACSVVYAEGPEFDFASMSTDELLALREQLNAEINNRLGDDNALISDGLFVAGVDIKPGMYRITCSVAYDDREFYVNLFESKEDYQTYDQSRWNNTSYRLAQFVLLQGGEATVNLTDGMAIEIYNGIGRIEGVTPDWAP